MKAAKWLTGAAAMPAAAALLTIGGCANAPTSAADKANLTDDGLGRLKSLERSHPDLKATVDGAYGYCIFPDISKGGLVVEAADGLGTVYEQGQFVGFAHVGLLNIGVVAGGESYTELLVFKTKAALADFEAGHTRFNATASAVALKAGVRADAKFVDDVAVFTEANSGFDVDASIGGQSFSFTREGPAATAAPVAVPAPAPATAMPAPPASVNPLSTAPSR